MIKRISIFAITLLIGFPFLLHGADDLKNLLGKWECRVEVENETVTLEFKSADLLIYNGEEITFKLSSGIINIEDEFLGWIEYPYSLKDGVLTVNYPEGYALQFKKVKSKTKGKDKAESGSDKGMAKISNLASHFVGTWKNFTQNTETMVVLYPDGTYGYRYTSSYSSAESGEEWGAAGEQHAQGRWTVKGTREKGVIVFFENDGSETQYNYQVHVENGEVYWNEYYFNDNLYGKNIE